MDTTYRLGCASPTPLTTRYGRGEHRALRCIDRIGRSWQRVAASLLLMLSTGLAQAALVRLDFTAILGDIVQPGYAALVTQGELVSGSVVFDFNPPSVFNVGPPISGSYTVSSGTAAVTDGQGVASGGSIGGMSFYGPDGASNVYMGNIYTLWGFLFVADIAGNTATLADYLALTPSDINLFEFFGLVTDLAGSPLVFGDPVSFASVQTFSITEVGAIPEPGALALTGVALIAAFAVDGRYRRRFATSACSFG